MLCKLQAMDSGVQYFNLNEGLHRKKSMIWQSFQGRTINICRENKV